MSDPTEIFIPLDDRTRPVTVPMYEAERKRGAAASETAAHALADAGNVFDLIQRGLASGHFKQSDAGLISLASICAAHFRALTEHKGEDLHRLKMLLDNAARLAAEKEESQ